MVRLQGAKVGFTEVDHFPRDHDCQILIRGSWKGCRDGFAYLNGNGGHLVHCIRDLIDCGSCSRRFIARCTWGKFGHIFRFGIFSCHGEDT